MRLEQLTLQDFRNYEQVSLGLDPGLNIFVGDNAQGKTNLLEAIYVLALSKSYRALRDADLSRQGGVRFAQGQNVNGLQEIGFPLGVVPHEDVQPRIQAQADLFVVSKILQGKLF